MNKEHCSLHLVTRAASHCLRGSVNDVILARGNVVKLIDIGLEIDGERVENLPGDGVIISTPTGRLHILSRLGSYCSSDGESC